MAKPHLLLVGSFILTTAIAVGCASGFVERESTSLRDPYTLPGDEAALHHQEAEELREAARYFEEEAQRSVQETGQDSERAKRYRDFAHQASEQAQVADRYVEDHRR